MDFYADTDLCDSSMKLGFSFIIPTYNEEKNLRKTIVDVRKCFIGRDAESFEIIVVDNGSDDQTPTIAEQLGVTCVVEPDINISEMRNLGAEIASEEILVFIDADISLADDWLESVLRYRSCLDPNSNKILGSHCRPSEETPYLLKHWFTACYENPRSAFLPGAHIIIHSKLFSDLGGFNEKYWTNEDVEFGARAVRNGYEICHCNDISVIHRGDPKTTFEFIKRECWHGTADFLAIDDAIRSMPAMGAIAFLGMHLTGVVGLSLNLPTVVTASIIGILLQLLATSQFLFSRSSLKTRIISSATSYLYYVGRSCSLRALFSKSFRDHEIAKSSGRRS